METDLGNVSPNPKGTYDNATAYEYLDLVEYQGGSYLCIAALGTKITGTAPTPGKNTDVWQTVALPGNATKEYLDKHADVIENAKQVETSRAAVELCKQEVESAQADVEQMRQDTQQVAQNASDANTEAQQAAQQAEASRSAAQTSEQNAAASRNLANTYKEAAETAKSAAETAAQNASESKTAAETAAQNAAQSKADIDSIKAGIEEAAKGENVLQIQKNMNDIGLLKEDLGDITQIDKSSNILEISDYTEGRYYSASSGDYRYNNDFSTVDNYVEVEPSCSYVLSEFIDGVFETLISTIIIFYDKNKKFLSGGQYSTFITPEDAKYIRLSLKKDLIGKQLLVEKGTEPTKIWVPYYKRLHLKGGRIIDLSYGVLKNKPTINGVEVSGDKSLEDYGITKASEIAETYGLCKTNEITVDISGNGDFRKLQDAINSITDNFQNNRYVIYIKEGEYDLAEGITDGENDASIVGVTIPNWITLKGVGDRKNIILQAKFKNKMQYVSTLNFKETGGIENLTVIGENTRYTIHDDDARNANGYERNVKHCIIKGLSTYYSVVYGSGSGDGAKWDFEDVVFDGTETGANKKSGNTFTVHNLLAPKQNRNIIFKNCIFKSANNGNVKFKTLAYRTATGKDDARNMVTNVALYGCKFEGVTKGFELVEENPDVYGKGCYYYVNGFGNINAGYEIITTDDKDYSDRVNLI